MAFGRSKKKNQDDGGEPATGAAVLQVMMPRGRRRRAVPAATVRSMIPNRTPGPTTWIWAH